MVKVRIAEREIPLVFNMRSFARIEEEVGMLADINDMLTGKNRVRNMAKVMEIMGNEGIIEQGEGDAVTVEWLMTNMVPVKLSIYQLAIMEAFGDGMKMETEDKDKEVDVTLREICKKKEKDY